MQNNSLLSFCVIDDDKTFLPIMKITIEELLQQLGKKAIIDLYDKYHPSINHMDYAILFLDIEMPDMNGYEIAKLINRMNSYIVYTTAIDNYSFSGYENHGYDFIRKSMLHSDTGRVLKRYFREKDPVVKFSSNGYLYEISFSSIIIIRVSGNYLQLITDKSIYKMRKTLKDFIMENDLMRSFIRVNQSEVINPSKIIMRTKSTIYLSNQETVYISRKYYRQVSYLLSYYHIEIGR